MLLNSPQIPSNQAYAFAEDSRLRLLFDQWQAVRGNRQIPDRRDFDPLDMVPILPMLWLCDYHAKEDVFRFRLAGDRVREMHGRPVNGVPITDLVDDEAHKRTLHAILMRVIDGPLILFTDGYLYHCQNRYVRGRRLILPMTSGDGMGLIGVTSVDDSPAEIDPHLMNAPIIRELPLP
ncbi:PAS domain-containing protein [Rhodospirillaceae bacterium KN72]|uniref:PAS domain-containing protein n=1 Tax=Pacificispira spongiicola TaxID=2729598 RepID=A0A7Y0HEM4_9PROT|nr:PAS domain-containing protein [Pacificispira spongiicola]NMM44870.1 PAS domain-containing protein [Pacificispira spongiicola]